MTIKQDLKNLSKSIAELKLAKKNKKKCIENFAKDCDISEYWQNYLNSLSLEKGELKDIKDVEAFELRSTACFYKVLQEPQFKIRKCGNVRSDGTVLDGCCGNCEHYGDIKMFTVVSERLNQAKTNRNEAAIKLLSNFLPFLKTYTK